jgi:hypothetical protein
MIRKFLIYSVMLLPVLSFAHGGEDHGASAELPGVASAAPRAEAQTDLFELVVTAQNGLLTIYVDDFAHNQPIEGAKVEIESGNWKAIATAVERGIYHVDAPQLIRPGTHPLVFTVTAGNAADLIETTLVVKDSAQASVPNNLPSRSVLGWLSASLIAMAVVVTALLKRRQSAQEGKSA